MYQRSRPVSPDAVDKPYRFLRMPDSFGAGPLIHELEAAAPSPAASIWKWHIETRFLPLRGGPAVGSPCDTLVSGMGKDCPVLRTLPRLRQLLNHGLPARARLAWIGISPPGARIFAHIDNLPHWQAHHRVHLPLQTNPRALLLVQGRAVHMPAGSMWLFNNSRPHAAINRGPRRLHLMVDLPDTLAVRRWLDRGEAVEGRSDPDTWSEMLGDPLEAFTADQRADEELMQRVRAQ